MSDQGSLISHLVELRTRLIRCVVAILVLFILLAGFSADIYHLFATPMIQLLPQQSSMIATQVAAPFLTPFKLTLFVSVYLVMPYILFQLWMFIAPGLYEKEKQFALPVFMASVVLFYTGTFFALYVVSPLLYAFFNATTPEGVMIMPDISHFLDFILKLSFGFGLAFEVPVITFMIIRAGIVSADTLRQKRPYIIVATFVMAMLLTPPDVVSQLLLAVPALLLFEIALFLSDRALNQGNASTDTSSDS